MHYSFALSANHIHRIVLVWEKKILISILLKLKFSILLQKKKVNPSPEKVPSFHMNTPKIYAQLPSQCFKLNFHGSHAKNYSKYDSALNENHIYRILFIWEKRSILLHQKRNKGESSNEDTSSGGPKVGHTTVEFCLNVCMEIPINYWAEHCIVPWRTLQILYDNPENFVQLPC